MRSRTGLQLTLFSTAEAAAVVTTDVKGRRGATDDAFSLKHTNI
jgi:hypothetical protein